MTKILIGLRPEEVSATDIERMKGILPGTEAVVTKDPARMQAEIGEVEITAAYVPPRLVMQAPNLRWHQQWGAGSNWLMKCPEAAERPFILTNSSGVHAIPISEHIFALLLALARRLPQSVMAQSRRDWAPNAREAVFELAGKTMLVVGLGAIGERTARVAAAMGMRVLGVRRNPDATAEGVGRIVGPARMGELLPEADFVVITVPLTRETKGMIGERQLRQMKPSAYLVNIGRGETIDESALERALAEKWIAGAGLDVFASEPLRKESPLWQMENVIITAHCSGCTPHYNERAMAIFLDNLGRLTRGEPMRNLVDKRLGY